jgi:putative Ca2+/H+ antiporter (TMEM165/GDT1 family)
MLQSETFIASDSPLIAEAQVTPGLLIEEKEISIAIPAPTNAQPASTQKESCQFWKVFGTTFITIFLAELGDKTQVATLLMSAEFHAPWIVFTGAAAALITTSLLGVLVGRWLSTFLAPKTLDTAAGVTMALISAWLLWDVFKG